MRTPRYTLLIVLSVFGGLLLLARYTSDHRSQIHPESSYGIPNRTPPQKSFPAQIEQDHQQPALLGMWWPWQQIESSSQELWADIPVSSPREFWAWTKNENRRLWTEPRRASWGGLKSQGARAKLRENLRDDKRYFATGPIGGYNNQVMTTANALYAARFSDHIPIVFPFQAISVQLGGHDHDIAVSDVFDLDRLALIIGQPIVELHELRQYDNQPDHLKSVIYDGEYPQTDNNGTALLVGDLIPPQEPSMEGDKLGCYTWGQWFGDSGVELFRFRDASWTPLPRSIYAAGQSGQHASFISDIVKFSRFIADAQSVPDESLEMLGALGVPNPEVLPDPQVFCVDNIYWELEQPERWDLHSEWREGGGVWGTIAQHMRFQPALIRLADDYLLYTFGLGPGQEVPPFFAVHIRRGDFPDDWLAMSVNQWAHAAWEAMQDLKRFGTDIKHVVFTTDEQDPAWRDPLLMLGWHFVDHEVARSAERFGYWLPTVLDTLILARATGFLGSAPSTMSILAYRRVVDWNGGLGRWMNYGHEVPEGWVWTW